MMKRDAIAALFDALIFLAIASLVSVALLSAFNGGEERSNGDEQSRVEAAHLVLLRSTVLNEDGNAHTVEETFKLDDPSEGRYSEQTEERMDLLLPGLEWRWTVRSAGTTVSYGSAAVPGPGGTLYCSLVRAPLDGQEVVFRLEAWSP